MESLKALIASLICCTATLSLASPIGDVYAVAPNQIGGRTFLSLKTCPMDRTLRVAYSFNHGMDDVAIACWYPDKTEVIFITESGTIRHMPIKSFTIVK